MKLVIFGATGKVGRHATAQALEQGYEVTACVRSAAAALGEHPKLKLIVGDVLNSRDVDQAIKGQDAVMITLGKPIRNKEGLRTKGTANIIRSMQSHGPKRLVVLSGHGVAESHADLPALYRWFIMPFILNHVYADHEKQEALVKTSGLDWTLVRPTNYFDGAKTGAYKVNFGKKQKGMKFKITYNDVAEFMVGQIKDNRFVHAAPSLSA